MNRKRTLIVACLLTLLTLSAALVIAQEGDPPPLLMLTSPDVAHPVQFQLIAPGDVPTVAGFTSTLELATISDTDPDAEPAANIVYVAIENTGWSQGVIGLRSDTLDPEAAYVALEVDAEGVPLAGGLAFDLAYDEELEGFTLPVLIDRARTFGVFRVADAEGEPFAGQTNRRTAGRVTSEAVEYVIDPEPVFVPFVLECHIVARPIPTPAPQPTSTPVDVEADTETGPNPAPQTGSGGQSQPPVEPPATDEPPPPPPPPPPPITPGG
ncbi:MAG: hypothetical protein JXN59_18640 [Anaerolineae bacterium]|nr:hypothetical protein [Anaerolineae bacterium]